MKNQSKIYTIFTFFIILSLFLITFLIYPTLRDIKNDFNEISSKKSGVAFINQETKELDNFKKIYRDYKSDFDKMDQLFVNSENPVNFIKFLEKVASDSDISASIGLVPSENQKIGNLPNINFNISAKGNFLNMLKFSEKLETGPYLIRINNVEIKKSALMSSQGKNIPSNKVDANFLILALSK